MKAEKAVGAAGIECKLVPAPRHLSHDCGVALRFRMGNQARVESALMDGRVEYESIADME